ncbi:MAG: hypothetical protein AAF636_21175 [Pseudomonadota bacterium]
MSPSRYFWPILLSILFFGVGYRLFPLFAGAEQQARFFITEDGYLMLTVARNLALGNGLSVSDGTIATNGVQPLATFIYTLPYLFTGGDKQESLFWVILIMATWSVMATAAIYAFARAVLAPIDAVPLAALAAVLWFVGPLALLHSMNALETGLYVGLVAATMTVFGAICARPGLYTYRDQVLLGCLCGLVFLARIDGAILVMALFAVRFVYVQVSGQASFREAVAEAFPTGLLTLVFALPWLLHNHIFFGSIMPISGPAQSLDAVFGNNLNILPVKVFETMFPMFPIPSGIERVPSIVMGTTALAALVFVTFLLRILITRHPQWPMIVAYTLYGAGLMTYYGLFFGAGHFLSRYMAPLGPLLIVSAIWVAVMIFRPLFGTRAGAMLQVAGLAASVLAVALLVRLTLPGVKDQGHFQVVEWVEDNVGAEDWVGAIQTGTLGYWHDRTINLDGKVNPDALTARRDEGDVLTYVTEADIKYLVDWASIAGWVNRGNAGFTESFEVVVEDRQRNLGVLRRKLSDSGN